jgi:hypothetical protein
MQQLSPLERILLRAGVVAAILFALWMFGLVRTAPPTVY